MRAPARPATTLLPLAALGGVLFLGPLCSPVAAQMRANSAIRGCTNPIVWAAVSKPDAASCYAHCTENAANACEWKQTGKCYVEFGSGCFVEGGYPGWWAALVTAPPSTVPIGWLDSADGQNDGRIRGWALDRAAPSTSIDVHIYVDRGTPQVRTYAAPTNVYRADVNATYGVTGNHGYDFAIPGELIDGHPHTVEVFAIDPHGTGNPLLSGCPKSFTHVPSGPVLGSPFGNTREATAVLVWNKTAGATEYQAQIEDVVDPGVAVTVYRAFVPASSVCPGSSCTLATGKGLAAHPHKWRIQARNSAGAGTWSSALSFTVQVPPSPVPIGPSGPNPSQPTYRWRTAPGATSYLVQVDSEDPEIGKVVRQRFSASAVCSGTECVVRPAVTLLDGGYSWRVLGGSAAGDGLFSSPMRFVTPTWTGGTRCSGVYLPADFDADGRTDRLCSREGVTNVSLSTGQGFTTPAAWLDGQLDSPMVADFNGDGAADLAQYDGTSKVFRVALSTGTSFAPFAAWGTATAVWTDGQAYSCGGGTGSAKRGTGNFDGNGYADVYCRGALGGKTFVGKSTGSSFTFSIFADYMCEGDGGESIGPADFDGDGRDDWYCIDGNGGLYGRLSTGQAFEDRTFQGPGRGSCAREDWSFVDINADGRTDATCRTNGVVLLSTGAAMVDTGSTGNWCNFWQAIQNPADPSNPTWVLRSQMQPMDTDGDRVPELVCTFAGPYYRDVHVRKWNGQALGPPSVLAQSWCETTVQGGDFDGDGTAELVCDTGVALRAGEAGVAPDLLAEASNGIGGRTFASYGASSVFGCNKPPVRSVVTSTAVDDGQGGVSTTSYSYCDGRTDPVEGTFLGYGRVATTLPCLSGEPSCPVTTAYYSQDLRTLGRPTLVRRADGAGKVLQETRTFFRPQSGPALPRQALVSEVRTTDFAPSGGATKTTSVTYTYDGYANVTQVFAHGEVTASGEEVSPNDELRTDMTYWPADTESYLVSRPRTRQVSEERGQGSTLLKSVETTYTGPDLTSVRTFVLPGTGSIERTMRYDTSGNLVFLRSELGAETTIVWTPDGLHPASVTSPEGTATTSWDPLCDAPTLVTDPNGAVTTVYDRLCRVERTEGPIDGSWSERSYEALGDAEAQHVRVEGPSSAASGPDWAEEYFDGLGRTYRSVRRGPPEDGDIRTERTYNARGSVSSETAPVYAGDSPETTHTTYDAFDRIARVVTPDGKELPRSYGLWTVTTTDPKGKETTVESGTTFTVERTTIDSAPVTTRTEHDLLGRRVKLTDTLGNVWTWRYDSLDRVKEQVDPDSGSRSVSYDDAARTQTETDALRRTLTVTYDVLGRVVSKATADGTASFRYGDENGSCQNWGRLTAVVSPDPQGAPSTLELCYDAAGQVMRQKRTIPTAGYSGEVVRQYDLAGRLMSLTYADGTALGPFGYDEAGRLKVIPGILDNVTYDALGRPKVQVNANGTTTTRTYYAGRGVLDTLVTSGPGGPPVQDIDYDYDPDLPLVSLVRRTTSGESWTYDYDGGYRLKEAVRDTQPPEVQTWTYDALGRMTSNSRIGAYTYPADGQARPRPHAPETVAGQLYQYDDVGNLIEGGGRQLSWDAENRVRAIRAIGTTTGFTYDTFGERLKKTSPSGTSLYPFGDDYEVTNGVTTKYVSVEGLGVVAKRVTSAAISDTFWLHTDRLGSIEAITNTLGKPVYTRTYRPYGETLAEGGTHAESRGWIDQRNDPETGLTYLHARYFDPQLGVFLSPDPIGVAGGMNLYGYALGNPVNGTDRSGLLLDQCYDDPECKIRVYGPGVDGQASNPAGPGVSFFATGPGRVAAGAGGGLLVYFFNKIAGLFASHNNSAPRDPNVPPATAYVPGKHIDPYSDYEEPGEDSLVSLVPTATAGAPTTGVQPPPPPPPPGPTPQPRPRPPGTPVLIAQEMSRFPIWDQLEPFGAAREVFPNSGDITRDRQRHCFISCIQMRSNGPLFTWWLTFGSGFDFLQIPIRGSADSSCDIGANAYGSVGAFTLQTCERLCSSSPFNRP